MELAPKGFSKIDKRAFIKYYLISFLTLALLLAGILFILFILFKADKKMKLALLENNQINHLTLEGKAITSSFRYAISDLVFLSRHLELIKDFHGDGNNEQSGLISDLTGFLKQKGVYDQLYFIDKAGVEILRIDYNDGEPLIVHNKGLQTASERDYFKDTISLAEGELFVSPFYLSNGRDVTKEPTIPTISIGTPVFDESGNKTGVIILDYLGNVLIDNFAQVARVAKGDAMLLNSDGYWLYSQNRDDEFGFMFSEKRDRRFGVDFPNEWKRISMDVSGQFYTPDGLFTFSTIYPLLEVNTSGKIDRSYYWKVVLRVAPKELNPASLNIRSMLFRICILLIIVIFLVSFLFARAREDSFRIESTKRELMENVE